MRRAVGEDAAQLYQQQEEPCLIARTAAHQPELLVGCWRAFSVFLVLLPLLALTSGRATIELSFKSRSGELKRHQLLLCTLGLRVRRQGLRMRRLVRGAIAGTYELRQRGQPLAAVALLCRSRESRGGGRYAGRSLRNGGRREPGGSACI
jgi:hypothetical protein